MNARIGRHEHPEPLPKPQETKAEGAQARTEPPQLPRCSRTPIWLFTLKRFECSTRPKYAALATPSALTLSWPSWPVLRPSGQLSQRYPLASPRVDWKQHPQRRGDRETGPCCVYRCSSSRAKSNVKGLCCPWCVRGVSPSPYNPADAPPYVPHALRPAGRAVRASPRGIA